MRNLFREVWEHLIDKGDLFLRTEQEDTPFLARAKWARREGSLKSERVIAFLLKMDQSEKWKESARSYECCWGHYYNCYGQRMGMYCEAMDSTV